MIEKTEREKEEAYWKRRIEIQERREAEEQKRSSLPFWEQCGMRSYAEFMLTATDMADAGSANSPEEEEYICKETKQWRLEAYGR